MRVYFITFQCVGTAHKAMVLVLTGVLFLPVGEEGNSGRPHAPGNVRTGKGPA
jgi:hypothetical protein